MTARIETRKSCAAAVKDTEFPSRTNSLVPTNSSRLRILWLIAAFITGLVLFWLFPALSRPRLERRSDLRVMERIVIRLAQVERVIVVVIAVVVMKRYEREEVVRVLVVAAGVRVRDDRPERAPPS